MVNRPPQTGWHREADRLGHFWANRTHFSKNQHVAPRCYAVAREWLTFLEGVVCSGASHKTHGHGPWRFLWLGPGPCRWFYGPCPMSYVICPMFYVICPMSYVLCPMSYGLCPMSYVLCPVSCVLWPMGFVTCLIHRGVLVRTTVAT